MSASSGQVWVTSILKDEDVENALLLCYSLRRVYTSKKVAVILSPNVSNNFREVIYHEFDHVAFLDETQNKSKLDLVEFAKIYSFVALQAFDNCVYLSPTMIALKNCVDIFWERTSCIRLLADSQDTSVFAFKPSFHYFKELTTLVATTAADLFSSMTFMAIHKNSNVHSLESKYNVDLRKIENLTGYEKNMSIVNLKNYSFSVLNTEGLGYIENLIFKYIEKLQQEHVQPLLSNFALHPATSLVSRTIRDGKEPIAIVGMSCRYPGCNNLEEFWTLLFQGKDGTSNAPPFRWLREQSSKQRVGSKEINSGFLKNPVDQFDAKFFGISPKEALFMDPQQRLLHELVWESLEDACINPQMLRGSSGSVFLGAWNSDYKDILEHSGNDDFFRSYMGNSIGAAAARISFLLGLTGPSIATESACSSSMGAVHLACASLHAGNTNLALACGVNLILNPFDPKKSSMIMAPDGRSKTFSNDANGYGRAEGGGVLVLKRLSDAARDGDRVWALVKGSAMTQEGISSSMGTPTVHCESLAMTQALVDANVDPDKVSYVESHGTGTLVGDPMEVAAIAQAYHSKSRKEPLIIGSVKTNVGHTEPCSGITGIMKVALAMYHECIPAHRNFSKLNPSINLDAVPAILPLERMEWKRMSDCRRIAGVSSFGITGTDAHVILEEPPSTTDYLKSALTAGDEMERPLHILKVSAKSEEAMTLLLEKYKATCQSSKDSIVDITYSANTGRANFPYRTVIIANSKDDICKKIEQQNYVSGASSGDEAGKICFLFTGQGSQYPGMAKQLYETSPVFRMHFELCDRILRENHNISVMPVIWGSDECDEINRTMFSQPSIFCVEYALLKLWECWGVRPDYVLGHSLGEFAAAVCAGILSLRDAVKLVAERSKMIDELPSGKMLVIRADMKQVNEMMNKYANGDKRKILDIAAVNSEDQTVIAGGSDIVKEFSEFCQKNGFKCLVLKATHAFHSKHMDPMLESYRKAAQTIGESRQQSCGYISGMEGCLVNGEQMDTEYWIKHTRERVNFMDASKIAVELGCQTFIEIGPHPILSAFTMANNVNRNLECISSLRRKSDNWSTLLPSLASLYLKGVKIDWNGFDQLYARKKVQLPSYPFIGKRFWPEMHMGFRGNSIHPLIGCSIPNASTTKLFESGINLANVDYIKEHGLGNMIIFPGGAYLEMFLAAGFAAVHNSTHTLVKPNGPVKIENFNITVPLAMEESKTYQLQTVVKLSGEEESGFEKLTVKLFHRQDLDSSTNWVSHASARFSQRLSVEDQVIPFDTAHFLECVANPGDEQSMNEFYDILASLGYCYGPKFTSLHKMWTQADSQAAIFQLKVPFQDQNYDEYVVHPIILDAMLQSMLVMAFSFFKKFHVPCTIGKFIWLPTENVGRVVSLANLYLHTAFTKNGKNDDRSKFAFKDLTCLLVDSTGRVLAQMTEVDMVSTTLQELQYALEQQTRSMADLWEEVWSSTPGSTQHSVRLDFLESAMEAVERFQVDNNLDRFNDRPDLIKVFSQLSTLAYCNMLMAMYACGWEPKVGEVFSEPPLMQLLGVKAQFAKQFHYFLTVFKDEGILEECRHETVDHNCNHWKIIKTPPSLNQVQSEIASPLFTKELVQIFSSTLVVSELGRHLDKILKGVKSPLSILFQQISTQNGNETVAEKLYRELQALNELDHVCEQRNEAWFNEYKQQMSTLSGENRSVFRILEIGAGTGGYSQSLLAVLEKSEVKFEYTYTDISSSFFAAAQKKFERFGKRMTFKKLNIEEDPIMQGFVPGYYDIVCAYEVLHATRNLKETMANVRILLKPNGFVDILENTKTSPFTVFIFGLLDDYWRFEDFQTRPSYCVISRNSWCDLLRDCGFKMVAEYPCVNDYFANIRAIKIDDVSKNVAMPQEKMKTWIVFHAEGNPVSEYLVNSIPQIAGGRQVVMVSQGEKFEKKSENSFSMDQHFCEEDFHELMKIISKEACPVEGIVYCWSLSEGTVAPQETFLRPYLFLVKSLRHLSQTSLPKLVAITNGAVPFAKDEISNFWSSTMWGFTKSLANENPNLNCKCIDVGIQVRAEDMLQIFYELWSSENVVHVALKEQNRFIPKFVPHKPVAKDLKVPTGVDKFQLRLPESKSIDDLKFGALPSETLESDEIEIQVKSAALNMLDLMNVLKPSRDFKDGPSVGCDISGVVVRVGTKVTNWSIGDPVFGLQWKYALSSHIKMHEDDVLAVPENMTFCEASTLPLVFGTTYSCLVDIARIKSSDTVLIHTASGGVGLSAIQICKFIGANIIATVGSKRKENYLRSLGIQHIFNSRNTDYAEQILTVTSGRGVDVVLNSLTSPGFKEATLKACAQDARFVEMSKLSTWQPEEVQKLRPDVKYSLFDLRNMKSKAWRQVLASLKEYLMNGGVSPIPYVRFDAVSIRDALHYLQNAKHIGKIVCVMPEVKQKDGAFQVNTPIFHSNATYLITGGLGGIGFEVCKWMVDKGAKYVLLAGRKPPNPSISGAINSLNTEHNAKVQPVQLDVSNYQQCKQLIRTSILEMGYPVLRGIMHAAGTLNDGLIENQTWEAFSSTFRSKVDGTLNLHELTKNNSQLENFVLFSSAIAQLGMPGQSNYAAGNQFEDSLAHYRHSMGLPATSVNWGQWGQVGLATEVILPGIKPFSTVQAIAALEYALKSHRIQTSVVSIESFTALSKRVLQLASYVDEKAWKLGSDAKLSSTANYLSSSNFWQQFQSTSKREEKVGVVKKALASLLAQILQLDPEQKLDEHSTFQEMGVDSLMLVQINNSLQSLIGDKVQLSVETVREFNTLKLLSEKIVQLIDGGETEVILDNVPALEALKQLIKEDCYLPEYIMAKPEQSKCPVNQASCVMLTGSSGVFGPYILKELAENPQITAIICVMRPNQKTPGMKRLMKAVTKLDLHKSVDMSKVTCVEGNAALAQLGMEDKVWEQLCNKVDAVFHMAAYVRHTERYKKHKSANNMRAVNVDGVKQVLNFASTGSKLKHVFFASTLFAVTKLDKNGYYFEDWSDLDDIHDVTSNGYLISKFVGEMLMKQAVLERGIPGKVFRFPHLTGNSQTGRFVLDANHVTQRFLFILKHKMITPDPFPIAMMPVDTCASVSVKLFFDPAVPNDIYNVNNTTPHVDQEFIDIAEKLGYKLNLVKYSKFIKILKESTVQDSPFALFKDFYTDDFEETLTFMPWLQSWKLLDDDKKKEFMIGKKIKKYVPEFFDDPESATNHFYRDMLFAKSQNWLEKN